MNADPGATAPTDEITLGRNDVLRAVASVWWLLLLRGLLLVVVGVYALLTPGLTVEAFAWVLGVFVLCDGVLALIAAAMGWVRSRGWTLLRGVLGVLAGIVVLANPALFAIVTVLVLVTIIAIQAILAGGVEVYVAIRERKEIEGEGWMILSGVLSIIFGLVLLAAPLVAGEMLVRVIGVFAILFGVVVCYTAVRLRGLGKRVA